MKRRAVLAAGGGLVVVAAAAPYVSLLPGRSFEGYVADRIGVEVSVAVSLLRRLRNSLGDTEYDRRAVMFVAATRWPFSGIVPDSRRRDAVESFIVPLLESPPARLAYVRDEPIALCRVLR